MMYIDAVCRGIDDLPTISDEVRRDVMALYQERGLQGVRERLGALDPASLDHVDPLNPRRNIHALEICVQAGMPCSRLLTGQPKRRDFEFVKYYIDLPRQEMFDRINRRVDRMVDAGLLDEARDLYPLRGLNALNTVGYKEMFAYFDGAFDFTTAVERIKKNTRVYAKKQLTWLRRDPSAIPVKSIDDILS